MNKIQEPVQITFSTKRIEELQALADDGFKLSRDEKFWFSNLPLVRRAGVVFSYTDEELVEYAKCKLGVDTEGNVYKDPTTQTLKLSGIQYFAENYCKIKNEMGQIKRIRLRKYQMEILDMFMNNNFSCLMASRQTGKCYMFDTIINTNYGDYYIFELWYQNLKKKSLFDKIKYYLYFTYVNL